MRCAHRLGTALFFLRPWILIPMTGFHVVHPRLGRTVGRCSRGWCLPFLVLVGILLACPREIREDSVDLSSLSLACRPVAQGVQCQLFALLRNGTLAPRDVTAWASWHVAGRAQKHLSSVGMQATGDGDVVIDAN